MTHEITLVPGDGTGPELVAAARRVLEATGVRFAWEEGLAGADVAESVRRTEVALKGPTSSGAAVLDAELDLFATIRPCKAYEGVRTRFPETDLVVVTRLEEDERGARAAFDYALAHGRSDVTEVEERTVATLCSRLLSHPESYDVISLPSPSGDLVSGMVGGVGVAPGFRLGTDVAVFEAAHGTAPGYEGQDKLNPTALMLSGVLLLRHVGEADAGDRLETAIAEVIRRGEQVTYDSKPTRNDPSAVGTSQFADAVIEEMNR